MLKAVSGIAIVLFSTFCGYLFAGKYRQRKLFFTQFKEFNQRFLNEIAYYRRPIKEFFSSYPYKGGFGEVLTAFYGGLRDNASSVRVKELIDSFLFLKKEDCTLIEDYFYMLGKGDSSSQNAYFSSQKDKLAQMQSESEEICKKYGDLYIKIGFLIGLFVLILIV